MDETVSFPEVLALAAEGLRIQTDRFGRYLADHVIVDEAQDLHATHWAMLRALVPEGPNDLFIAEDSTPAHLRQPDRAGPLRHQDRWPLQRLTLNYRTTAQNLRFAVGVLAGAAYADLEQGRRPATIGRRVTVRHRS